MGLFLVISELKTKHTKMHLDERISRLIRSVHYWQIRRAVYFDFQTAWHYDVVFIVFKAPFFNSWLLCPDV